MSCFFVSLKLSVLSQNTISLKSKALSHFLFLCLCPSKQTSNDSSHSVWNVKIKNYKQRANMFRWSFLLCLHNDIYLNEIETHECRWFVPNLTFTDPLIELNWIEISLFRKCKEKTKKGKECKLTKKWEVGRSVTLLNQSVKNNWPTSITYRVNFFKLYITKYQL